MWNSPFDSECSVPLICELSVLECVMLRVVYGLNYDLQVYNVNGITISSYITGARLQVKNYLS